MLAAVILLGSTDDGVWRAQAWTNHHLRRQTEGGKAAGHTLDPLAASPARIKCLEGLCGDFDGFRPSAPPTAFVSPNKF